MSNLPEMCYGLNADGALIAIKRNQPGYFECAWSTEDKQANKALMIKLNEKLGVTTAQFAAMIVGSMQGWDCPEANPELYKDLEGVLLK